MKQRDKLHTFNHREVRLASDIHSRHFSSETTHTEGVYEERESKLRWEEDAIAAAAGRL